MAEPSTVGDRAEREASRYVEDKSEIIDCLKALRDERASLTLRLEGSGESYSAKVLDVNDSVYFLEDISPRTGLQALQERVTFSISARAGGLFAFIEDARVLQVDAERGLPFFHVALPKRLLRQQRRRAARVKLPLRVSAEGASVTLFRDEPLVGKLIDISVGGCRAEFDATPTTPVATDEEIDVCAITISHLLELHSRGAIRHASYNKAKRKLVVGIELTEMHVTDRRRLEQFIQTIARSAEVA